MNNLRSLRQEKALTIAKAADCLGIPFETYRSYEIGRNQADYETLIRIAEFYGVSVDYILGRDELTPEERAAGARDTIKKSITPIEDEMLYAFREVGKKLGVKGQRAVIDVAESMAGIK